MPYPTVVYDIDGCVLDWFTGFRLWMDSVKGYPPALSMDGENFDYNLTSMWPTINGEEINRFIGEFNRSPYFGRLSVMDGAVEVVERLQRHLPDAVHAVVTAAGVHPDTIIGRLQNISRFGFEEVHVLPLNSTKCQWLKMYRPGLLIEDSVSHANRAAKDGWTVALLDRPYNRVQTDDRVLRVKTWHEIEDHVRFARREAA